MPANIASTSFNTTPDNKAVVVDIYSTPPLTPINNAPGKLPFDLLNQIGGANLQGSFFLKEMATNYMKTGRVLGITTDQLLKNAADNLKMNKGLLRSIGGNFLNNVLKGTGFYSTGIGKVVDGIAKSTTGNSLDKMVAGGFKDLSVTINGVNKVIKNIKDVDSLTDLSKFLNGVAPDNPFLKAVNLTEIAGVVKGVSEVASFYSIPGALDRLVSHLDKDDKKVVLGLVASGTTTVTDLTTVDTLLDHLSGSEILGSNPNMVKMILSGFSASSTYPDASPEAANALKDRLDRITPHWHQYHLSNDTWSDDLDVFAEVGAFARSCFLSANLFLPQLAVAGEYKARTFATLANEYYPYIGLPERTDAPA